MPFDEPRPEVPVTPALALAPAPAPAVPLTSRMRELFGPNGERWAKGAFIRPSMARGGELTYCLVGARMVAEGWEIAERYGDTRAIQRAGCAVMRGLNALGIHTAPTEYNDHCKTSWPDIVRVLDAMEQIEAGA